MLIIPSTFLGPVSLYARILQAHEAGEEIYEDWGEHYVKQTCRSRASIAGPQGVQTLTVPVKHGEVPASKTPIGLLHLSAHGNWTRLHREALQTAYEPTPYFEYFAPELWEVYARAEEITLGAFNAALRGLLLRWFGIPARVYINKEYMHGGEDDADWRKSVPDGTYAPYFQPFASRHGFLPNLSALDLAFNLGPEARMYLRTVF